MERYGQLFSARHYDRFLPSDTTFQAIRQELIQIDIRTAIIYGSATERTNVIGNLYEKLIDDELRATLGAVYTPDETMRFHGRSCTTESLGQFRGHKVVEPACGSGHFYREITAAMSQKQKPRARNPGSCSMYRARTSKHLNISSVVTSIHSPCSSHYFRPSLSN